MRVRWTETQTAILKKMLGEGKGWDEISKITGHPLHSCRSKSFREKIQGIKQPKIMHRGVASDGKDMGCRSEGKPIAKKPEMRPCICCKTMFKSWDRTKNQRCNRCADMYDPGPFGI